MENYGRKYDEVADIYDEYVRVDFDIPFWIEECKKVGKVLELTAGTGRISLPLASAGIIVAAVDVSQPLLNILRGKAKKEGLKIELVKADIRSFDLKEKYRLIILPFNSLEELVTHVDHISAFVQVRKHMKEGGHFILTIHNPKFEVISGGKTLLGEFREKRTGHLVKFFNSRFEKDHLAINEQVYEEYDGGTLVAERKFVNRSYTFEEGELEELSKSLGFRVDRVWGCYHGEPPDSNSQFLIYELSIK